MKKLITLILIFTLLFTLTSSAFAANDSVDLERIARETIQVKESIDDEGFVSTTFENMDIFLAVARNTYPNITDLDLAMFLMSFTYQDYTSMPEEEILHFLIYDNITTETSYIKVDSDGNYLALPLDYVTYADWTSDDGYMKISTNYAHISTEGSRKTYEVWALATWLQFPSTSMQDVFILGTNAIFNDQYNEFGYVSQSFKCRDCSRYTSRYRYVNSNSRSDNGLVLSYESFVPKLQFDPAVPQCDYCDGVSKDNSFSVYIRYGIGAYGDVNIQAGYGHKYFGPSNISTGIDSAGCPNISVNWGSQLKQYIARAVTVVY